MRIKRAVILGVVVSIVIFLVGQGINEFQSLDAFAGGSIAQIFTYLNVIDSIVFTGLFSLWYFNDKRILPDTREGLVLGAIFVAISIMVELILILTFALIIQNPELITEFYKSILTWASYVLMGGTAGVVGWMLYVFKQENENIIQFEKIVTVEQESIDPNLKNRFAFKLLGYFYFTLGLSLIIYPIGLRIMGIIFLIAGIGFFIKASANKQFSTIIIFLASITWAGVALYLNSINFLETSAKPYQLYMMILFFAGIISSIFLGWSILSKKR